MRSLAHEVYSREEIIDALHGKLGSRSIDFRFDLLDKFDQKKGDVSHLVVANSSSIDMDNQAEIHRSAKFNMRDDGTVNFLSDRIQPWAVLKMPPVRRTEVVYEDKYGENLLRDSKKVAINSNNGTHYPISNTRMYEGEEEFVRVRRTNPDSYPTTLSLYNTISASWFEQEKMTGEKVTLSVKVRASHPVTPSMMSYYGSPTTNFKGNLARPLIGTEWSVIEETIDNFPALTEAQYIRFIPYAFSIPSGVAADQFFVDFAGWKFEIGDEATPWSPAKIDLSADEFRDKWQRKIIRPKVVPSQDIEFPLGVFLLSTPEKSYQNQNIYRSIQAYDKLQILLDDGFTARYVANEGEYVTDVITDIIQQAGITQINIIRSEVQLPTWFSWDPDVSRLEVVNQLLQAINYERLYVDEYGYFTSQPYRSPVIRSAEYDYKTDAWSVISPGATALQDFFAVPNQWVGVISEPDRVPLTYTYENLNRDSPTSIPARGRTKTEYVDVDAADIESLQGIVQKKAFEDSQVHTELTFQTALMPMHSHNDVYRLQHHKLGIDAKFQELSWSMTLSAGAPMAHTAREIITV